MTARPPLVAVRWTLTFALAFAAFALGSFGYLFFTTTQAENARIDDTIARELGIIANLPPAAVGAHVKALLSADEHRTHFAGLFAAQRRIGGNLARLPTGLVIDGRIRELTGVRNDERGSKIETMRAGARNLRDGRTVVIAHDLDSRDRLSNDLTVAMVAGALPALGVALALGFAFSIASQRRVRTIEAAIDRIVAGDFTNRLPVRNGRAETDRILVGVNRMLDAIEMLYGEIRGIGDDMAHELRTPLGRVRAQLERSRETAHSVPDFQRAVDRAIAGLDQTLAVIIAILRIGQIEHRARRSGFARVDLRALVHDVADYYAPVAEDASVVLTVEIETDADVDGDRDLLFEALANLVDNAIKFSSHPGHVTIRAALADGLPTLIVADDGPGIPSDERGNVVKRFVRGDKSRHVSGAGLGLSLVAAIARLHECTLTIADGVPGCVIRIDFHQTIALPQ